MKTNFRMLLELKDYTPANPHFTSDEEVQKITDTLHLKEMDILGLRNLRDFVVLYYENKELHDKDNADINVTMDNWRAMQSITAVIDHTIWELGGEV